MKKKIIINNLCNVLTAINQIKNINNLDKKSAEQNIENSLYSIMTDFVLIKDSTKDCYENALLNLDIIEKTFNNDDTPLCYSIRKGLLKEGLVLIILGHNVLERGSFGYIPLALSVRLYNVVFINYLLNYSKYYQNSNMNESDKLLDAFSYENSKNSFQENPTTILSIPINFNIAKFNFKYLVKTPEELHYNILCCLLNGNNDDIAKQLNRYQFNKEALSSYLLLAIKCIDLYGYSRVYFMSESYYMKTIEILLKCGAKINYSQNGSPSSLTLSILLDFPRIALFLITEKADVNDVNMTTPDKVSLLNLALKSGRLDIFKALITKGADINEIVDGKSLLLLAIEANEHIMAYTLMDAGANIYKVFNGKSMLEITIKKGFDKIVYPLIESKIYLNEVNNKNDLLVFCLKVRNFNIFKYLISSGFDINYINNDGDSLLDLSINLNYPEFTEYMLENGVIIKNHNDLFSFSIDNYHFKLLLFLITNYKISNFETPSGNTPLLLSIEHDNIELYRILIKNGVNINYINKYSELPLHFAYSRNKEFFIEDLIQLGADLGCFETLFGKIPMLLAIERNDEKLFSKLLENKNNLNYTNGSCVTPLYFAYLCKNNRFFNLLVELGANLDFLNPTGKALIHLAVESNDYEILTLLSNKGANFGIVTKDGLSPLAISLKNNNLEMTDYILNKGINFQDNLGRTPLMTAITLKNYKLAYKLVMDNCNLNLMCCLGKTALVYAIEKKEMTLVDLLLKKNPLFLTIDNWGFPHLFAAIESKKMTLYNSFINKTDANVRDLNGNTALMFAIHCNNHNIIPNLIERKIDLDAQNNDGDTALILAAKYNHFAIIKLLITAGADIAIENNYNESLFDTLKDQHKVNSIITLINSKRHMR